MVDDKHVKRRSNALSTGSMGANGKMNSDSDREHKIRLRVSNQKAYVWDVEGTC